MIDCGGNRIRSQFSRIVGTLVLLNVGPDSKFFNSVFAAPAAPNYPTLLVQGDFILQFDSGNPLDENWVARNFNPPGTPYEGQEDIDQDDLAPGKVLVSILKRIDVAVFEAIRDAREGRLEPGHRWIGIADGATGLSGMKHTRKDVPERALEMVERAEALIREGKLTVPWRVEDLEVFQVPEI